MCVYVYGCRCRCVCFRGSMHLGLWLFSLGRMCLFACTYVLECSLCFSESACRMCMSVCLSCWCVCVAQRADLSSAASLEMWKAVNDFNWHKVQQSPHWSVLPAAEAAPAVCLTAGGEVVSAAPRPPPLPPSAPLAAPLPPAPQGGDDDEL